MGISDDNAGISSHHGQRPLAQAELRAVGRLPHPLQHPVAAAVVVGDEHLEGESHTEGWPRIRKLAPQFD